MSIESLLAVLDPPAEPRHTAGRPWSAIEAELGVALPADYKAYVERYGYGRINELVIPLNPHATGRRGGMAGTVRTTASG